MVFIVVEGCVLEVLKEAAASTKLADDVRCKVEAALSTGATLSSGERKLVQHRTLLAAVKAVKTSFKDVMERAELRLTDRVEKKLERPKELDERLNLLRRALEEKQYRQMVRDVGGQRYSSEDQGADMDMRSVKNQMSVGLNVIVTMLTCFAAGYFLARNYFGTQQHGLYGGLVGIIVGLGVEGTLVITRVYMIDENSRKQEQARARHVLNTVRQTPAPPADAFKAAELHAASRPGNQN
eukprot:Plantae.Rhodophyta-Purpureofilum_apyrenoidigerum.ctg19941.p1 GENE.Plantae.Rhodophyta-Purpureofilum_apyrenoidigerum.ctg19941~~Plantae.Rhodophyta-Purpureofilum_apyrenoidigerum.ctg19941.p1  ORF type:complete len:239 (+),score=44.63 Plantae.Rhodophyta-Purpureofilum_apyrenoidigerum.ctg19941:303-1019(+)